MLNLIENNNEIGKTITKKDLVLHISNETGISKQDTSEVVQTFIDKVTTDLALGNTVVMRNFGSFEVSATKPKVGRNPKKPEQTVQIPSRSIVKFKPGKALKQKVARLLPKLVK